MDFQRKTVSKYATQTNNKIQENGWQYKFILSHSYSVKNYKTNKKINNDQGFQQLKGKNIKTTHCNTE